MSLASVANHTCLTTGNGPSENGTTTVTTLVDVSEDEYIQVSNVTKSMTYDPHFYSSQ